MATVRDLRNNFGKLESWLAEGQQVKILKRDEPVANQADLASGSGVSGAISGSAQNFGIFLSTSYSTIIFGNFSPSIGG